MAKFIIDDLGAYLKAVFWESKEYVFTSFEILGIVLFLFPQQAEGLIKNEWTARGIGAIIFVVSFLLANFRLYTRLQSRIAELGSSLATEKRSIASALAMLTEEIDQNLEELTSLWKGVKQVGESSHESPLVLASRFTDLGPPTLSSTVWEKQCSLLTKALSDEQLRRVQSFYNQLIKVTKIHFTLRSLRDEQRSLKTDSLPKGSFWGVVGAPRPFDKNAPSLWEDLEQIALRLIEEGSPLEDRTCR